MLTAPIRIRTKYETHLENLLGPGIHDGLASLFDSIHPLIHDDGCNVSTIARAWDGRWFGYGSGERRLDTFVQRPGCTGGSGVVKGRLFFVCC
jgi:hypothetical protein